MLEPWWNSPGHPGKPRKKQIIPPRDPKQCGGARGYCRIGGDDDDDDDDERDGENDEDEDEEEEEEDVDDDDEDDEDDDRDEDEDEDQDEDGEEEEDDEDGDGDHDMMRWMLRTMRKMMMLRRMNEDEEN